MMIIHAKKVSPRANGEGLHTDVSCDVEPPMGSILYIKKCPRYPRAEHPVVRTHPVTRKKALYVNRGFTRGLVGVPHDESDGILNCLYQHMEFQCRFLWQENSIAFCDNRCVQHRAMWAYWPHTRSGNRVTVAADRP